MTMAKNISLADQDDKQSCFPVDNKQFLADIVKFIHVGKKCRRDMLFSLFTSAITTAIAECRREFQELMGEKIHHQLQVFRHESNPGLCDDATIL